jgi:hypothetical protein
MGILGLIPAPSQDTHARARIWAIGGVGLLAILMLALMAGAPPRAKGLSRPVLSAAQLTAFQTDAGACRAALLEAGFAVEPLPDLREGRSCGYAGAVELSRSVHAYSAPLAVGCAAAAALALWERDVVDAAAKRHLRQRVERIELAGPAYSCRAIAGRKDGRMSEHASANAIDIRGFTLADGRVVSVAGGWNGAARERAFLRAVRDGACAHFRAVLSPDYNQAHRDHLHFDLGRDELCR